MHGRRDSLGHGSDLAEPVSVCKESVESLIVEVCVVKSVANNVEHRPGIKPGSLRSAATLSSH